MRDYTVHLLFHVLVIVAGVAAGFTGAVWWDNRDERVLWLASGALIVGIVIVILQAIYISGGGPPERARPQQRRRPRAHGGSAAEFEPVAGRAAPPSGTLVRHQEAAVHTDEETRTSAADALKAYQASDQTRR